MQTFLRWAKKLQKEKNIKTVVLMGQTRGRIESAIEKACAKSPRPDAPLELIGADSYMEAFMVVKMLDADGDTVLLSPLARVLICLKITAERGDIFRSFVFGCKLNLFRK